MKIFIIGQCTLHWGRMEFGNIGNYYIMEPFFRELHRVFPSAEIRTTMQMSERFCVAENVSVVPMSLYYGWQDDDLEQAERELELARTFSQTGKLPETTPYIDQVLWADLVIDFSGDIWGSNADFLGENRFHVGLCKDRVAQLLGKKVVMLAGSPGPFSEHHSLDFAKEVFANFDLVTNREPVSTPLLARDGFDVSKTHSLACPAFLFEPSKDVNLHHLMVEELGSVVSEKPIVGFVLCGWNFEQGPFDLWPRSDDDYIKFAEAVEYMTETLGLRVCLMSHSNGFDVAPAPFVLKHGRDYPVTKQLESVLQQRGIAKDFFTLNGVYDTWQTKSLVGQFDMLVSGRIHAAVAGLSQTVPTVIIDYGHEPKAHKLLGFATVAGAADFVADPAKGDMLKETILRCWQDRETYREKLKQKMPEVSVLVKKNFELVKELMA